LAGGTPVALQLKSAVYSTRHTFGQISPMKDIPVLDAMAALSADQKNLTLMVVHRGSQTGPVAIELDAGQFPATQEAEVLILAGKTMYDRNSLEEPERIKPQPSVLKLERGKGRITLPPYSLTRLIFHRIEP
jgi:alpha-N-arabinofuranosidase